LSRQFILLASCKDNYLSVLTNFLFLLLIFFVYFIFGTKDFKYKSYIIFSVNNQIRRFAKTSNQGYYFLSIWASGLSVLEESKSKIDWMGERIALAWELAGEWLALMSSHFLY
jgi:hypothetical protein